MKRAELVLLPAHDIASDYVEHGVDVTIYQRDSTYIMTTKEGMPRMLGRTYPASHR